MRHGKALLGDKVRYTVEMLISAVPSQSPFGRQLSPRRASLAIIVKFSHSYISFSKAYIFFSINSKTP